MITTAIFDLEGVIIDTEPLWTKSDMLFLKNNGVEVTFDFYEENIKPKLMGVSLPEGAVFFKNKYDLAQTSEELATQRRNLFRTFLGNNVSFMPGFHDFFVSIRNNHRTAIATSLERQFLASVDQRLALSNLFKGNIFSIEDIGFISKPNPAIFLHAAKMLGSSPQNCVVFEDSPFGVLAAKSAGMKCIALTTTTPREVLNKCSPDLIVDSFSEIDLKKTI